MVVALAKIPLGLGTIFTEENEISNKLITIPRPLGDTSNNTAINLGGKVRIITITGSNIGAGYSGGDVNTRINAFITAMEAWLNTNLQTKDTYTDGFGNTYSVLCQTFRWTRTAPGNRILYVLIMIEGGALAAFGL